jgi:exodeoxyribonuclease V alpha subunit
MCKIFKSRLILLGDIQQLPSIEAGTVLKNIINSDFYEITKLTEIKRQKGGCLIKNIMKMSKNEIITQNDFTDSTMSILSSESFILNDIINTESLIQFITQNNLNKKDTKFITPFKKLEYKFNTNDINNILQNIFNPRNTEMEFDEIPSNYKYDDKFTFRIKDKIVRTENDYGDNFRANGEEAEIIDYDGEKIIIQYSGPDDKPEEIRRNVLYEEFALNYAVTIHKSQGSQYSNVVVLIEPNVTFLEKASIYTAISRTSEKCIIISTQNDFISCQKSNNSKKVSLFMRISNKYKDYLPDYSETTEIRYYLEISYDNKHIANENNCIFDKEKKLWYTLDNKIYELFKSVPLLQKNKTYDKKEFIKKNGGRWCKETKMWYTYNSNELLKEFM